MKRKDWKGWRCVTVEKNDENELNRKKNKNQKRINTIL